MRLVPIIMFSHDGDPTNRCRSQEKSPKDDTNLYIDAGHAKNK